VVTEQELNELRKRVAVDRITNHQNLPQPLVDAVRNDNYASNGDISVTTLLAPPRKVALEKIHADEITEDASDRIWSLMGQVVHGILERADKDGVAERRLEITVEGWVVSGAMDRYEDEVLQDYKVVTVHKFKDGGVPLEYEQQLNIYAEILRQHGHPVKKMQIVGILRDWSKLEARRDENYPQSQVVVRNVPMWHPEDTQRFIRERVVLHQQARVKLPECSPEERWARPTKYAVMKEGGVRAVKLYDNEADAKAHAATNEKLLRVDFDQGNQYVARRIVQSPSSASKT
jgi:hypothetical protein